MLKRKEKYQKTIDKPFFVLFKMATACYDIVRQSLAEKVLFYPKTLDVFESSEPVFSPEECEKILAFGYSKPLNDQLLASQERVLINFKSNGSKINYIFQNETTNFIYEKLRETIQLANMFAWNFDLLDFGEPIKFAEYLLDAGTNVHTDINSGFGSVCRKLTVIVQLTDESLYKGGDLLVSNGTSLIPVTRKRGHVIIFPSFLPHQVKPVTEGKRNSAVTFAYGPPFR